MDRSLYENYLEILSSELIPALGCTEPIAIAYAAAKVREVLGCMPESINVDCSGNNNNHLIYNQLICAHIQHKSEWK